MPVIATANAPTSVDPERLYSLAEFIRCSGLSYSRIRRAARDGLEAPTIAVGRRKFIQGSSGIAYILQLAAMHRDQQSHADLTHGAFGSRIKPAAASDKDAADNDERYQDVL